MLAERLHTARARVDALVCEATRAIGGGGEPALEGGRSVSCFLAARTGAEPRSVRADVRLGTWLVDYPAFAAAFGAGWISRRHVEALRRVENPRTTTALAEAQDYLIEAAETCSWVEFTQVLRYWALGADPDGVEPVEQRQRRFCRFRKEADGSVAGSFLLDPIDGHALVTAIEDEAQRLFRTAEIDEAAPVTTLGQRRADAFTNVVVRGAARVGGRASAHPLVHLVMSEEVASAALRQLDEPSAPAPTLDPFEVDGRCELVDGTPVHPRVAVGALASATLRRLVIGADSQPADLGRRTRTFPSALRQALLAAARGRCREPGCDAPTAWLEADHLLAWQRGGPTSLRNGQMLCGPHNRAKGANGPPVEPGE